MKQHPLPHAEDNVSREAHSLNQIAVALVPQGDLKTAKKLFTQTLEMNIAMRGPTSKHLIPILLRLAEVNRQQGQNEEAAEATAAEVVTPSPTNEVADVETAAMDGDGEPTR